MYTRIGILGRARQAIGIARLHAPREALYIDVKYNSHSHRYGSDDLAHLFGFTPILNRDTEPWHKAMQLSAQNPTSSANPVSSSVEYSLFSLEEHLES
jgi:hypothetical protein